MLASNARADDGLLWLETPHDPKALEWAKALTAESRSRLAALPVYTAVTRELESAMEVGSSEPRPVLVGTRALRLLRDRNHPHGLLQVALRDRLGVPGQWRTALDVGGLRQSEGRPLQLQTFGLDSACLAPDYDRCLLRLSSGGSDEVEIREFDLKRGRFVDNGFHTGSSRAFAEWIDADLLLIQHAEADSTTTHAGWPTVARLWKRGTPLASAKPVFSAQAGDTLLQLFTMGQGTDRLGVIVRTLNYSSFEIHFVDRAGHTWRAELPRALKPMGVLAVAGDRLIVQLAERSTLEGHDYPAESLLSYTPAPGKDQPNVHLLHAPKPGEFIAGRSDIAASGSAVAFIVNERLVQRLLVARPAQAGWATAPAVSPDAGEMLQVAGSRAADGDFIVTTTGFTTPRRMELLRPGQPMQWLAEDPVLFDPSEYATEIASATSRDGTRVDYYLLRPKASLESGAQPLLMTGYGAFGISVQPGYFDSTVGGPAFKLWLQRGGALAIPAIRGGGERGSAWHHAAIRENRQRSYDDFIAVAESLIANGYTRADRIGIFGMSNGGLLTATLGIQRPDLFAAVVSDVPLTDLIRMRHMGMGAAWLNEYGDPTEPEMAKVLRAYSPVHNVAAGVDYPPFLITISTEDNRVGPGHARKLAARLDDVGSEVYFIEDAEGGHGVSDALRNPALMALRMTFLLDRLMPTNQGVP
ncbi:MAG: prolyl oligopeptidase family serine peptidase [Lysobacter sp.]